MPDLVVDWVSDCSSALFAVYVTDIVVVDWRIAWLRGWLSWWLCGGLVCCLCDWLCDWPTWMEGRGVDSFVLWHYPRSHYFCRRLWLNVDWVGDSLAAFFGVDVTDLVVDCKSMTEWLTELVTLTALFAVYVTDLVVDCKCLTKWLTELVTLWLPCLLLMWLT